MGRLVDVQALSQALKSKICGVEPRVFYREELTRAQRLACGADAGRSVETVRLVD